MNLCMKINRWAASFAIALSIAACQSDDGNGAQNVYFTPSRECEARIIELLDKATIGADMAVYAINNDRIVESLKKAHQRGLHIRILTDRTQAAGRSSKVGELRTAGLDVRLHSHNRIMHNKYALFDGKVVMTGSYNWTNPASDKNAENCLFMDTPDTIAGYSANFHTLWLQNTEAKSEKAFEKMGIKRQEVK